jgi:hypothetical protein
VCDHGAGSENARGVRDEIEGNGMTVPIVDKPPVHCMAIHPLEKPDNFTIGQMVRKN